MLLHWCLARSSYPSIWEDTSEIRQVANFSSYHTKTVFELDISNQIVFKGGTSLSEGWNLTLGLDKNDGLSEMN